MKNFIFLILLFPTLAYADYGHVTEDQAQRIILGAASDYTVKDMYAVACAIRNRDSEYYNELAADISSLPEPIKYDALQAWRSSLAGKDVTNGANFWVRKEITGGYIRPSLTPPFCKKSQITYKTNNLTFYKVNFEEASKMMKEIYEENS